MKMIEIIFNLRIIISRKIIKTINFNKKISCHIGGEKIIFIRHKMKKNILKIKNIIIIMKIKEKEETIIMKNKILIHRTIIR
jgi:hypothetical protein